MSTNRDFIRISVGIFMRLKWVNGGKVVQISVKLEGSADWYTRVRHYLISQLGGINKVWELSTKTLNLLNKFDRNLNRNQRMIKLNRWKKDGKMSYLKHGQITARLDNLIEFHSVLYSNYVRKSQFKDDVWDLNQRKIWMIFEWEKQGRKREKNLLIVFLSASCEFKSDSFDECLRRKKSK